MRAEEEQLQAVQNQSTSEDDLSPLMPVVHDIDDMNGCLLSQTLCLSIGCFACGTLRHALKLRSIALELTRGTVALTALSTASGIPAYRMRCPCL